MCCLRFTQSYDSVFRVKYRATWAQISYSAASISQTVLWPKDVHVGSLRASIVALPVIPCFCLVILLTLSNWERLARGPLNIIFIASGIHDAVLESSRSRFFKASLRIDSDREFKIEICYYLIISARKRDTFRKVPRSRMNVIEQFWSDVAISSNLPADHCSHCLSPPKAQVDSMRLRSSSIQTTSGFG